MYFVALNRLKIIRNLEGRFEEAIIAYLFLVNLVPVLIIPMMWYEAKKVAQLLNHWSDFEVCTGDFLKCQWSVTILCKDMSPVTFLVSAEESEFGEKFNLTKWLIAEDGRMCYSMHVHSPHVHLSFISPCHRFSQTIAMQLNMKFWDQI